MPCQNPNARRGFTVVEMMLAVALLAILLGLAIPSLREFQQRNRLVAASNEVVTHINLARMHAVTYREVTVMCPGRHDTGCSGGNRWHLGWIVFRDPDRDGHPDTADDLLRVGPPLEGLWADSGGRTRIRYLPSGAAPGTNLTIKLCDPVQPARGRAVIVSNPGRPRVDELPSHLGCSNAAG